MAEEPRAPDDQPPCPPCRATGRVISKLGGTPHEVVCPWCGGTGRFTPGRNAQDEPAEGGAGPPSAAS